LITQGTPVNIIVGSHVWLEDPGEAWLDGVVTEIKGRDATIATTNGKTVRSLPDASFNSSTSLLFLFHQSNRGSSRRPLSLKIHVPTARAPRGRDQIMKQFGANRTF
jgi:hypothetical protein